MQAILRQGKSLHLATTGLTLYPNKPQQLDSVAQYVYLAAAHGGAVQLSPPPVVHTLRRDNEWRRAEPWQLSGLRAAGWHLCDADELMKAGARVLVIRNMGLGDVLMLTPALHALHSQRQVRVHLATYAQYLPLLWGLEWIEAAYALGTDYSPERFAAVIDLNWTVELGQSVKDMPRQDIFAHHLGGKLTRRRPYYQVSADERRWAQHRLNALRRPIIGIQTHASCPQRSYPYRHTCQLIRILQADGCAVVAFGQQRIGRLPEGVVDLTGAVSVRQAAALSQQMDLMICPDSGLLHLAVAVGTPTVGLFGPIPPWLRVADYPGCVGLSGAEACGCQPCFDMGAARCPDYRCMKALSPERVAETAKKLFYDSTSRSAGGARLPSGFAQGGEPAEPENLAYAASRVC